MKSLDKINVWKSDMKDIFIVIILIIIVYYDIFKFDDWKIFYEPLRFKVH